MAGAFENIIGRSHTSTYIVTCQEIRVSNKNKGQEILARKWISLDHTHLTYSQVKSLSIEINTEGEPQQYISTLCKYW